MDILRLHRNFDQQTAGIWHDIVDPATGVPIGIRLKIVGPDSKAQRRLRFALEDWLQPKNNYSTYKHRTAEEKDKKIVEFLAGTIIDWEIEENGKPIPCSEDNKIRVINAATWLRAQVDTLANYYPPWVDMETARKEEYEETLVKAKRLQDEMEQAAKPDAEEVETDADTEGTA